MSTRIGWVNNCWGSLDELTIPIHDRGLNYADGIFETILIWNGVPLLLNEHLNRWRRSAQALSMADPPREKAILSLINEGINLYPLTKGIGSIRLNWSRGHNIKRGIDLPHKQPNPSSHLFWLEINSIKMDFNPISTMISYREKRNASSQLNLHKTFAYTQSIQIRQEAKNCGYDEALIESTNGGICCGAIANLIVKRNNKYLTPDLRSGCLPGIMREQGIISGLIKEQFIERIPRSDDQWLLINSLSCKPIHKVNNIVLEPFGNPKEFWLSLYKI